MLTANWYWRYVIAGRPGSGERLSRCVCLIASTISPRPTKFRTNDGLGFNAKVAAVAESIGQSDATPSKHDYSHLYP